MSPRFASLHLPRPVCGWAGDKQRGRDQSHSIGRMTVVHLVVYDSCRGLVPPPRYATIGPSLLTTLVCVAVYVRCTLHDVVCVVGGLRGGWGGGGGGGG